MALGVDMVAGIEGSTCQPVSVAAFFKRNNELGIELTYGGSYCKVCVYEGHSKWSAHVVLCDHGVRSCAVQQLQKEDKEETKFQQLVQMETPEVLSSWLCPD